MGEADLQDTGAGSTNRWTLIGLGIALLGIPAIVFIARQFGIENPGVVAAREIAILLLVALLLAIVLRGERQTLSSIGLRFDHVGRSLWHAICLTVVLLATAIALILAIQYLGTNYGEGVRVAPSLALTTLTVLRAGIAEEVFYRGFALERIQKMTGSPAIASTITLIVFAGFHYSGGWAGILIAFVIGGLLTLYYVWKRDLLAAIIAHFLVDFIPNVLLPLLGADR